jgi:hypothetical protein
VGLAENVKARLDLAVLCIRQNKKRRIEKHLLRLSHRDTVLLIFPSIAFIPFEANDIGKILQLSQLPPSDSLQIPPLVGACTSERDTALPVLALNALRITSSMSFVNASTRNRRLLLWYTITRMTQNSVYFLLLPRALLIGYFLALILIFSAAATPRSTSSLSASRIR